MMASKSATYNSLNPRVLNAWATSNGSTDLHKMLWRGWYSLLLPLMACTTLPFKMSMTGITFKDGSLKNSPVFNCI